MALVKMHLTILKVLMVMSALAAFVPVAHGGSRGYYVAFVDVSAPQWADGTTVMLALRKSSSVEGRASCWACEKRGEDTGIAILYVKKLPAGVNAASVKEALTKGGATLDALQKRLRDFSDDDGTRLDGLYAYDRSATSITLHAIAPRASVRVAQLSQPVKERIRAADLDAMLEKLAKSFPFVP